MPNTRCGTSLEDGLGEHDGGPGGHKVPGLPSNATWVSQDAPTIYLLAPGWTQVASFSETSLPA